ncbi:MAG: ABC transporter ATP-binding protein [Burkholderiales bacterium]|nr:ABC transporter ATP-binding protein [Burkholderiales bacterium]
MNSNRSRDTAVEVVDVCKSFPKVRALDHVSLRVEQGEFFALLGPNGAGKTTLISILAGLTRADSGSAKIMGFDTVSRYREARSNLGVVPQELVFDPFFTVRETLALQAKYYGVVGADAWIDEILHHLDLTGKANTNMRALSGGMKRRVLVGQALVHKPPVIVLDEPTAGVDVELRQNLWTFIKRLNGEGHTIILTTHYLEEAEALCNRVAMLKGGRIVALDTTANLLRGMSGITVQVSADAVPPRWQARGSVQASGAFGFTLSGYPELETLLSAYREANIVVREMKLGEADLEQAFLKLTSRESSAAEAA